MLKNFVLAKIATHSELISLSLAYNLVTLRCQNFSHMKKKNCTIEYEGERARWIYHACRKAMKELQIINVIDMFRLAVNYASPRYWVSEDRALYVLRRMLQGDRLTYMRDSKRRMFYELFWRYIECRRKGDSLSNCDIVRRIIYNQASSSFISPNSAKSIYYNYIKNEKFKNKH